MAEKVKGSIDIEAPVDEIFAVATDFESYPRWASNVKNVEIKDRDPEGRPSRVWFEVDAKIRVVRYTLEYEYSNAPGAFSWTLVDGDVKDLSGSYAFDDFGGATEVTFETQLEPGFPIPGLLKRQGEKLLVKAALDDLKKEVEARK